MAASAPVTSQNRLFNFFWPSTVTENSELNHDAFVRRMETVLGLMVPGMATTYGVLEYGFHCTHSAMIIFFCTIPLPALFASLNEHWADSTAAKIEALRQERLKSSQAPPPQPAILTPPLISILKKSGDLGKGPSQPTVTDEASGIRRRTVIAGHADLDPKYREDADGYPLDGLPEPKSY